MHKAMLYENNNSMQQVDAAKLLTQYMNQFRWAGQETVLDVGCGPGDVTSNVLLPLLPVSVVKVVGLDVSPNMIRHATAQHTDPKLEFLAANIADPTLEENITMKFNKIFSFHCLHWVQDQKQAMRNIYNMLVPGGEVLLLLNAFNPIYDQYEKLAKNEKWSKYMQNLDHFVSPYHHSTHPVAEMTSLLQETGFHIYQCHSTRSTFSFANISDLKQAQASVIPFLERIPTNLQEEFMRDSLDIVFSGNLRQVFVREDQSVTLRYDHIVVFARK